MIRVGLLGAGGIGARHAAAVAEVEGMELVASCGRDPARTEAFAAKHGGAAYADVGAMLDRAALDLLIVALPPFAHDGQVEAAARRGVHLLVEKPIALSAERAASMVAAASGVTAACGFMYRFGGAVERWDRLVATGAAGRIAQFSGSFHCNALHAPWWRDRALSGGQMVEQLIHIVDLARVNLGMPRAVYARAAKFGHRGVPGYSGEDISAMILSYDSGAMAVLHASNLAVPGRWDKSWQVIGERKIGRFADLNAGEFLSTEGDGAREVVACDTDPFVAQLTDLRDAIGDRRPPRVPLRDGELTLRIVLAARRSADTGREVRL